MRPSKQCYDLIKTFEGLRLESYKCSAGKWTIGYGHTNGVKQGQVISRSQAQKFLEEDVARVSSCVDAIMSDYIITQSQYDALVSFTFNLGSGNLQKLTDYGTRSLETISKKMLEYVNCNGKPLNGLIRRRQAEQALFLADSNVDVLEDLKPLDLHGITVKVADNYRIRTAPCANSDVIAYTDCTKKSHYEIHGVSDNYVLTDKGWIAKEAFPLKFE